MTGEGFVLTPEGDHWLDAGEVLAVEYGFIPPEAPPGPRVALHFADVLVFGMAEPIRLGAWATSAERSEVVTTWLAAVCALRVGRGEHAHMLLGGDSDPEVGVVWAST